MNHPRPNRAPAVLFVAAMLAASPLVARAEACHTLRVRADQAAGQQRHVRATVSHVRRAVGA